MTVLADAYTLSVASYVHKPTINLRARLLREGEITTGEKFLKLFRGLDSMGQLCLVFWAEAGNGGEYSAVHRVDLATFQSQGEWLAIGSDDASPRKVRAAWLTLTASGDYTFNISSGEGGDSGSPAAVSALVRVDAEWASREVIVIERPSDGQWRLAGYGPTPGGSGEIELRVTDGDCYAVGVDDYGVVFTPNLDVTAGQTVRPSQYAGWLYRITEPGRLPATEPTWWAGSDESDTRQIGTARGYAVRYFQPIAHGPVPVET